MSLPSKNKFIFHLVHDFVNFRLPELESVCEFFGAKNCLEGHNYSNQSSLFTCRLPSDDLAQKIASRCVLLKSISHLYYENETLESLLESIRKQPLPINLEKNDTFKIEVYTFGKIYSQKEKIEKIEKLIDALKFDQKELKVCLKDDVVKNRFIYVEEWIQTNSNANLLPVPGDDSSDSKNDNHPKRLNACYFGRFLCNGQSNVPFKYNLKDRGFIGNTSMDPTLSLIMANMAMISNDYFIYDPFVGTGSLLVGAAHFGAHVAGADLDFNLIHSRGLSSRHGQKYRCKTETIRNNLKQYGLEDKFVDILVADFSQTYVRKTFHFDAIVTDPPYGIREKTKRVGNRKARTSASASASSEDEKENEESTNNDSSSLSPTGTFRIPQHTKYALGEIFNDLVKYAAKNLEEGGRLVFWIPVYLDVDRQLVSEDELKKMLREYIPLHPDLQVLYFSEQRLAMNTSRILVTMQRRRASQPGDQETLLENVYNMNTLNQFRDKYFKS